MSVRCEIVLRQVKLSDAADLFEYSADPHVCKYLSWGPHTQVEETEDFIRRAIEDRDSFYFAIEVEGKAVGVIRVYDIQHMWADAEVSYVLNPAYQGRGIMTDALRRIIKFCTDVLGLDIIRANYALDNHKSFAVLSRCGFTENVGQEKYIDLKGKTVVHRQCTYYHKPYTKRRK